MLAESDRNKAMMQRSIHYPTEQVIERIFQIISHDKVTLDDIVDVIGDRTMVERAIIKLNVKGRIKRVRGFGKEGIIYFYRVREGPKEVNFQL